MPIITFPTSTSISVLWSFWYNYIHTRLLITLSRSFQRSDVDGGMNPYFLDSYPIIQTSGLSFCSCHIKPIVGPSVYQRSLSLSLLTAKEWIESSTTQQLDSESLLQLDGQWARRRYTSLIRADIQGNARFMSFISQQGSPIW